MKAIHLNYKLKLLYKVFEELEMDAQPDHQQGTIRRLPWVSQGLMSTTDRKKREESFLKYVSEAFRDFFKEHVVQGNYFEPIGLDKPTERNLQCR